MAQRRDYDGSGIASPFLDKMPLEDSEIANRITELYRSVATGMTQKFSVQYYDENGAPEADEIPDPQNPGATIKKIKQRICSAEDLGGKISETALRVLMADAANGKLATLLAKQAGDKRDSGRYGMADLR